MIEISMDGSKDEIISELKLQPHPEGGFYRETYRSAGEISEKNLNDKYAGKRNYSTCIYFLLTSDNFSAFHRINQDEIWHFYTGSPLLLHIISPEGLYTCQNIGINFKNAELPQYLVPGGSWFAAEVLEDNAYSLIGCTVSPGFDFKDFELKGQEELTQMFPQHQNIIKRLTHI